jgi:hypothetical protein
LNWNISGGSGYSSPPTITITGQGGIGTDAAIEADIDADPPNGLINFTITNVGSGYTVPPTVSITGGGGIGAEVLITTMIVTDVTVIDSGFGGSSVITNSDIIIDPIGGIGTGATVSVGKIVPTDVFITNSGSGYTATDLPVTATFSDSNISADVGLGVESISLVTTGLGYTTLPFITFDSPTLSLGVTATATAAKLGYDDIVLYPGPGFGQTVALFYVQPLTANSFGISTTSGGPLITLGYGVRPATTKAAIGGTVSSVDITFAGSNYEVNDVLSAVDFDTEIVDANVGTGFSFRVNKVVDNFQISELLLLQTSGTGNNQAFVIENSGISDTVDLGDFSADIVGGSARLRFTPNYARNEIKFYRTSFVI